MARKKRKMIDKTNYHFKAKGRGYSVDMRIDLNRQNKNCVEGQFELDTAVMFSMVRFMAYGDDAGSGTFIQKTRQKSASIAGSGQVYAAAAPEGRFLYEGKNMVDEETGSTYARKGARKVLVSKYSGVTKAKEDLEYNKSHNPDAQAHWFIPAKRADCAKWVRIAKQTAGGGRHG